MSYVREQHTPKITFFCFSNADLPKVFSKTTIKEMVKLF